MRTSLVTSAMILALLAATTGCSRYYWSKPGSTAEQFARDSQECAQQAGPSLPAGAAPEAIEQYYRACLNSRGYARAAQWDPAPPGSYRGVEDTAEFAGIARGAAGARQSLDQQLAQLDELKARGRITPEEYAAMRKRLIETATPTTLAPPAPPPAAAPAVPSLDGRWYGRGGAVLDIHHAGGPELQWEWQSAPTERVTTRAAGTGTVSGDKISLIGRQTAGLATTSPTHTFELTREGNVLRGTVRGSGNVPVDVEFTRTPP